MNHIQAVDCWRYHPEKVAVQEAVCPPSWQIDEELQTELYRRHPRNCIRLIRGRSARGEEKMSGNTRYSRMTSHLSAWRTDGTLYHDRHAIYLVEQEFSCGSEKLKRRGIIVRLVMPELDNGKLLMAEKGSSADEREEEYARLRALHGQVEPVCALASAEAVSLRDQLENAVHWEATVEVEGADGAVTRLWIIDKGDSLGGIIHALSSAKLMLLEHRSYYEAALHYRNDVRERMRQAGINPPELGALASDGVLVACFPVNDPALVLPPEHPAFGLSEEFNFGDLEDRTAALNPSVFPALPSGLVFHLFR